jgi:hypothetical protein
MVNNVFIWQPQPVEFAVLFCTLGHRFCNQPKGTGRHEIVTLGYSLSPAASLIDFESSTISLNLGRSFSLSVSNHSPLFLLWHKTGNFPAAAASSTARAIAAGTFSRSTALLSTSTCGISGM